MLYRLIVCIAVIGLVHEAAAADMDTAYLRGSDAYGVTDPAYPVQRVAAPWYPTSAPAPSDLPVFKGPIAPVPRASLWTGFYGGVHVGAVAGTANFADPFGSSIFGDNVTTPGFLAGGQIGYNWQVPSSNLVLGVEADANWLTSDGTNTCLAYSGNFVSANCRAQPNMMGDLTARVGWAYGQFNHSLFYVKGGAAFVHSQIDITTNNTNSFGLAPLTTSSSFAKAGWTVGAGVEHAITPAWSVKIEYDYAGFGGETVATPAGLVQPTPGVNLYNFTPAGTTRVTQNFQEANLGLNYKFGTDASAQWGSASSAFPVKAPVMVVVSGWELDVGVRDWYSSGRFQRDQGDTANPALANKNILISRLTYNTTANSGELFGRIEAPQNVFVKGNLGVGSILGGQLNDEDWAINPGGGEVAYSNTTSTVAGEIAYATLDLGYDFFRGAGYKLGAFVGYNYYMENKSAFGCTQIANQLSDCAPPIPAGSNPGITENDTWNSLRVGVSGDIMIGDRFKLGADVAYLPFVQFNGTDDHLARVPPFTSPESGTGIGLQLESILSYFVTDQFSVGVGGRYWALWTTKDAIIEFADAPCPCQTNPVKADRFGVFVQLDYRGIGSLLEGFR
jgi:opacity protein-like surface antigen